MKYSKNGFWVKKEADYYRIGLSAKGQDDLGDIAFIEILNHTNISTEDSFISVEASKAITELSAPINGTILEINHQIEQNPELLNSTQSVNNWIALLKDVKEADYFALSDEDNL